MMKRVSLIAFLTILILCVVCGCGKKQSTLHVKIADNATEISINDGEAKKLSFTPVKYFDKAYYPVEAIMQALGYTTEWDSNAGQLTATKKSDEETIKTVVGTDGSVKINDQEPTTTDQKPIIYQDNMYVSDKCIEAITGDTLETVGSPLEIAMDKRDTLDDVKIDDTYRTSDDYEKYNSIYIVGGKHGMELLSIGGESANDYASIINNFGKAVPDAKVYDIVVPTACEFYIPRSLYTNQVAGIHDIYSSLDDDVMPINVVTPLWEHADEKIYFDTDHHWTDRGAYYAYKAYADNKGYKVADLSEFETENYDGMVGSLATFTDGTPGADILRANAELLEKFMPRYDVKGVAYYDMLMQNRITEFPAINTYAQGYSNTFIGGDSPLAVLTTDNPSGKSLVVVKESYGNAFAVWACENYSKIYIVDPRAFNGFDESTEQFVMSEFYELTHFDDLVIINYPGSIASDRYRDSLKQMAK